jgi:2-polyprenyl-6-methoxyphenol hydroxylase-like FAD-dependent oxidoreductase
MSASMRIAIVGSGLVGVATAQALKGMSRSFPTPTWLQA